jgi:GntR family transcriptional regulator
MHFRVAAGDEVPIYRQIMRQVVQGISGGHLKPGEQLPSHRDLAERLVIAPLTVKKAYDELERLAYLETRRGQGTFVSSKARGLRTAERLARLRDVARQLLSEAFLVDVAVEEVLEILKQEDERLTKERGKRGAL